MRAKECLKRTQDPRVYARMHKITSARKGAMVGNFHCPGWLAKRGNGWKVHRCYQDRTFGCHPAYRKINYGSYRRNRS